MGNYARPLLFINVSFMENYPTSKFATGLEEVTLTASYNDDNSFEIDLNKVPGVNVTVVGDNSHLFNTLTIMFEYQLGASETNNTIDFKIENGDDADDIYLTTASAVSSGTVTLSDQVFQWQGANDSAPYKRSFSVDISDRFLKVSVKESGVAANYGTATVKYFLSKR